MTTGKAAVDPPKLAEIVAEPCAAAVTTPVVETDATAGLLDDQATPELGIESFGDADTTTTALTTCPIAMLVSGASIASAGPVGGGGLTIPESLDPLHAAIISAPLKTAASCLMRDIESAGA